jgi:F-type H+-transporting ATPase subunit beta
VAIGLQNKADFSNFGSIVSVRGGVVDVRFDGRLPPIFSVLHAGAEGKIIVEVMAQPGSGASR